MTKELLGLHNLESNPKARKTKIRRGRGNSSGKGNYSGRGMKGQKSRSGGKGGLKVRGLRSYLLRIPKSKGFKSKRATFVPINLDLLEKYYIEGELVSLKSLAKKELIPVGEKNVKILGTGKLTKKLRIKIDALSGSAKKAIIDLGGEILTSKKEAASVKSKKNEKTKVADEKKIEKEPVKAKSEVK